MRTWAWEQGYPEALSELSAVLAKDQFIDALANKDIRLWIHQSRPQMLRGALEMALQLESHQLASRQRARPVREVKTLRKRSVFPNSNNHKRGPNYPRRCDAADARTEEGVWKLSRNLEMRLLKAGGNLCGSCGSFIVPSSMTYRARLSSD